MRILKLGFTFFVVLHVCFGETIRNQKCKLYHQKPETDALMPMIRPSGGDLDLAKELAHAVEIGEKLSFGFTRMSQGTIISPLYILSDASIIALINSIFYIRSVTIRLGPLDPSGPTDRIAEKLLRHPDHIPFGRYNNIGLIKMVEKVVFTEYIRPICLPDTEIESGDFYRINYGGEERGLNATPLLNRHPIQLLTHDECTSKFCPETQNPEITGGIKESQLCGQQPVKWEEEGHWGGSLQIDHPTIRGAFIQVGMPSLKLVCTNGSNKEIFTRIFSFVDWIESIVWAPGNEK